MIHCLVCGDIFPAAMTSDHFEYIHPRTDWALDWFYDERVRMYSAVLDSALLEEVWPSA